MSKQERNIENNKLEREGREKKILSKVCKGTGKLEKISRTIIFEEVEEENAEEEEVKEKGSFDKKLECKGESSSKKEEKREESFSSELSTSRTIKTAGPIPVSLNLKTPNQTISNLPYSYSLLSTTTNNKSIPLDQHKSSVSGTHAELLAAWKQKNPKPLQFSMEQTRRSLLKSREMMIEKKLEGINVSIRLRPLNYIEINTTLSNTSAHTTSNTLARQTLAWEIKKNNIIDTVGGKELTFGNLYIYNIYRQCIWDEFKQLRGI